MELALNLIWVTVSLVGFALLSANLSGAARHLTREPSNRQKIIAMTCTLVILFFVISMTDDLHEQQMAVEESRSSRVTIESAAPSRATAHSVVTPSFLLFFAPVRTSFDLSAVRQLRESLEVSLATGMSRKSFGVRAPPTSPA